MMVATLGVLSPLRELVVIIRRLTATTESLIHCWNGETPGNLLYRFRSIPTIGTSTTGISVSRLARPVVIIAGVRSMAQHLLLIS